MNEVTTLVMKEYEPIEVARVEAVKMCGEGNMLMRGDESEVNAKSESTDEDPHEDDWCPSRELQSTE